MRRAGRATAGGPATRGLPIVEPGLDELVEVATGAGTLDFVATAAEATAGAELVFLCVATPPGPDGSADLSDVEAVAAEIASHLAPGAVVVNKSTVPVGTAVLVERVTGRDDISVVSNPEFLREGSAVIARIFNTYGPRLAPGDGRVVSNFVVQALTGQPLTVYGDGTQTRSLCYVDDQVDGLLALLASRVTGPVNIGNPDERTVADLARAVLVATGSASPIEHRPLPTDDPTRRCPDITLARRALGWAPRVGLTDGLARTVEYFAGVVGTARGGPRDRSARRRS